MDEQERSELEQSIVYLEVLKTQIESLTRQTELLSLALNEHNAAKEIFTNYKDLKKDEEVLIPIGANSFIFATVSDPSKAIVGIGADLAKEQPITKAIKMLETKIEKLNQNEKRLNGDINSLQHQTTTVTKRVQELYRKYQEEAAANINNGGVMRAK